LLDIRVEMGADCGAEPDHSGGADTTGVSVVDAQVDDDVVAEEYFYDGLEAPLADESDWSEYFARTEDTVEYIYRLL
jgi:hypothetical protein